MWPSTASGWAWRSSGWTISAGGFSENVPSGVAFVQGSVTDVTLVETLFREHRFRYVYHLAAYAAEGLSHFIRRFNYETNLVGSINLVNESVRHEVERFVFTSSIAVYGAGQTPMTEDLMPLPEDPYGISKYAVELDLDAAHGCSGSTTSCSGPTTCTASGRTSPTATATSSASS